MTTQEFITLNLVGEYWQIVRNGTKSDKAFAVRKLLEIVNSCPNSDLANWAQAALDYNERHNEQKADQ